MERGSRQGKEMGNMKFCFLPLYTDKNGIYYKKRKIPCLCFGEYTGRGENEKKHVVIFDMLTYVSEGKILHFLQFFMVFF